MAFLNKKLNGPRGRIIKKTLLRLHKKFTKTIVNPLYNVYKRSGLSRCVNFIEAKSLIIWRTIKSALFHSQSVFVDEEAMEETKEEDSGVSSTHEEVRFLKASFPIYFPFFWLIARTRTLFQTHTQK